MAERAEAQCSHGQALWRCCTELSENRHFMLEQPHGSGLFEEPQWQQLCEFSFKVVFDQCMVRLKINKYPYWPVRKTTEVWASAECLLWFLQVWDVTNNMRMHISEVGPVMDTLLPAVLICKFGPTNFANVLQLEFPSAFDRCNLQSPCFSLVKCTLYNSGLSLPILDTLQKMNPIPCWWT